MTSTLGTRTMAVMATKSRAGSNGSLLNSQGLMACDAVVAMPSVWPSGWARATASTPMLPPPPGRFSMMTVPSLSLTCSARIRAVVSMGPPAAKGTTMRVTRWPVWAQAGASRAEVVRAQAVRRKGRRCMGSLLVVGYQLCILSASEVKASA